MLRRYGLAALVLLLGLTAQAQDSVTIAWKFKEGDKFYLENTTDQKQTLDFDGKKMPSNEMIKTSVMSFKVIKVDKDAVVLEQKLESSKVKDRKGAAVPAGMDDKLIGSVLTITLNGKGEVTKIDGIDALIKKLARNDQESKMLKAVLTPETMKQGFQDTFAFVPAKAVSKGDTWKHKTTLPLGPIGTLVLDQEYTYTGPGKDGEHMSIKAASSYQLPKDTAGAPFKVTKGDIKAEDAKGTVTFDTMTGRLVRQEMKARIQGKLSVSGPAGNGTIDLHSETSTTIRILDKLP